MAIRLYPTLSASARAAAHRAMARSALFSDSSASVRLKRYNHHMEKARGFDSLKRVTGHTNRRVDGDWQVYVPEHNRWMPLSEVLETGDLDLIAQARHELADRGVQS